MSDDKSLPAGANACSALKLGDAGATCPNHPDRSLTMHYWVRSDIKGFGSLVCDCSVPCTANRYIWKVPPAGHLTWCSGLTTWDQTRTVDLRSMRPLRRTPTSSNGSMTHGEILSHYRLGPRVPDRKVFLPLAWFGSRLLQCPLATSLARLVFCRPLARRGQATYENHKIGLQ